MIYRTPEEIEEREARASYIHACRTPAEPSENAMTTERRLPKELPQDNTQGRG